MAGSDTDPFLMDEPQQFGRETVFARKDKHAEYGTYPKSTKDHRNHFIALLSFTLILPWVLFVVVFAVWSLQHSAGRAWAITVLGFLLVAAVAGLPYLAPRASRYTPGFVQRLAYAAAPRLYWQGPAWQNVVAFAMALALLISVFWGNFVFSKSFEEYDRVLNLQVDKRLQAYENVDPTDKGFGRLMNAGIVGFAEGVAPRLDLALGFRNHHTYCVAPIAAPGSGGDYRFWAAGVDCCTSSPGSFNCGAPNGRMGERILKGIDVEYYTLAVQKAESTFDISAPEPMFFRWVQDAASDLEARRQANVKPFLIGIFVHLGLQAALVSGAWFFIRPKVSNVNDLVALTFSPSGV